MVGWSHNDADSGGGAGSFSVCETLVPPQGMLALLRDRKGGRHSLPAGVSLNSDETVLSVCDGLGCIWLVPLRAPLDVDDGGENCKARPGSRLVGQGHLLCPTGCCFSPDDLSLTVADRAAGKVKVLSVTDGGLVHAFGHVDWEVSPLNPPVVEEEEEGGGGGGGGGEGGGGAVCSVEDVAVDGAGNIITIDSKSVKVFSPQGELLVGCLGGLRLGIGSSEEEVRLSSGSCVGFCALTGTSLFSLSLSALSVCPQLTLQLKHPQAASLYVAPRRCSYCSRRKGSRVPQSCTAREFCKTPPCNWPGRYRWPEMFCPLRSSLGPHELRLARIDFPLARTPQPEQRKASSKGY